MSGNQSAAAASLLPCPGFNTARMQRYILAHYLQQTPAIGVLKKNLKDIANEHLNPTQQHIKASLAALNDAMKLGSSYYD